MENPGLSWIVTLRGFLVSGTRPAPQRPATLRLERDHSSGRVICAGPIKPAALRRTPTSRPGCRETSPRHRDLNRPSRNRHEDATPEPRRRIPGTRMTKSDGASLSGKIKQSRRRPLHQSTQRGCADSEARHLGAVIKDRSPPLENRRTHTGAPVLRSTGRRKAGNDPAARTRSP